MTTELPLLMRFYLHQDGGVYRIMTLAKNAEDQSLSVVYAHVWPFNPSVWHRPLHEWASRFTLLEDDEAQKRISQDPEAGKLQVIAAKAKRRAAAG
jgi:hypothetical protein